jgi:LysM repeat protein
MIARKAAAFFAAFLVIVLALAVGTRAFAQISESDEPAESSPPSAQTPPSSVAPDESEDAPQPPPAQAAEPDQAGDSDQAAAPAPAHASVSHSGSFQYTVRPGDSLGSISAAFGVPVADLASANRISDDTVLMVGKTLHIPNPFAAQMRTLNAQVEELQTEATAASGKTDAALQHNRDLKADLDSVRDENKDLRYSVRVLPWWHTMAVTAVIAALLLLGVTLLALAQWWILRGRFAELAELSESLSRLDYKYKSLMAKAELRFQQLYGRRRQGGDGLDHGRTQEEVEIERLSIELRDTLHAHLRRLGLAHSRSRRRADSGDMLGDSDPRVEVRTARR